MFAQPTNLLLRTTLASPAQLTSLTLTLFQRHVKPAQLDQPWMQRAINALKQQPKVRSPIQPLNPKHWCQLMHQKMLSQLTWTLEKTFAQPTNLLPRTAPASTAQLTSLTLTLFQRHANLAQLVQLSTRLLINALPLQNNSNPTLQLNQRSLSQMERQLMLWQNTWTLESSPVQLISLLSRITLVFLVQLTNLTSIWSQRNASNALWTTFLTQRLTNALQVSQQPQTLKLTFQNWWWMKIKHLQIGTVT